MLEVRHDVLVDNNKVSGSAYKIVSRTLPFAWLRPTPLVRLPFAWLRPTSLVRPPLRQAVALLNLCFEGIERCIPPRHVAAVL